MASQDRAPVGATPVQGDGILGSQRPNHRQLLESWDRVGMDKDTLKYATPSYYLENVRINHQSSERIRTLLKKVDKEYLAQHELDD